MPDQPPARDPDDRQRMLDRISREQPEPASPRDAMPVSSRSAPLDDNPILTLFCGGLFLYAGFFYYDLDVTYKSALMGASVLAFVWMARIVGFGLMACAVLAWHQFPGRGCAMVPANVYKTLVSIDVTHAVLSAGAALLTLS